MGTKSKKYDACNCLFCITTFYAFFVTCVENIMWHSITNTFNASDLVSVGLETTREGDAGLNFSPGIASEH